MEPPHTYIRDASASLVHHTDYLTSRQGHGLCGKALPNPAAVETADPRAAVCPDCEARLLEYHLEWWRTTALAVTAELDELRARYSERAHDTPAQVTVEDSPELAATLSAVDAEPTTLLEHARKELLELCRQFDGAVPYRRVKNAMEAFSDRLTTDERVLLAQEIGKDGSLIRWCTTETESLGWRVTGNPVHGEAEDMWDAWTRDSYQTPKQSRWRLGRSRSHPGG